jgi:hypothetical protein
MLNVDPDSQSIEEAWMGMMLPRLANSYTVDADVEPRR